MTGSLLQMENNTEVPGELVNLKALKRFLDEIEGKEIIKYSGNIHIVFGGIDDGLISRLDQKDFKANFEKVINGE